MKAIQVRTPGGPEQLFIDDFQDPVPAPDQLLVRVAAAAMNRADLWQREGKYPPPLGASPLIGMEIAGEVVARGDACTRFDIGDRVMSLLPSGGYAQLAVVPESMALPVPENLSMEEASAIPEAFLTAYQALYWFGGLTSGMNVLVHAGASGVGMAAIQLARAAGATVFATASAGKLDFCRSVGANIAIDYASDDFAARVLEASNGCGADIIVDFIGAGYWTRNVESLALDGHLVILATLGGVKTDAFDLRPLFKKRANIHVTTLRTRTLAYQERLNETFMRNILPLFGEGALKSVVDRVFDWTDVQEAHRYMGENRNRGKIVLRVA